MTDQVTCRRAEGCKYIMACDAAGDCQHEEQCPSKELPATLPASSYDGDLWVKASGVMLVLTQLTELRRENVRWENAHKILLAENSRLLTELRAAVEEIRRLRAENATLDERLAKPAHEREPPHCSSCACGLAPEPASAPAMDTSNTPAEDTQQKVVSAVHYHAREIARLTETWPAPPHLGSASFTAYDIDLFDAGSGVAARMRPEQNGRYYLRSDVDAARASQPPGVKQ